jgi:hypothetical protein
VSSIEKVINKTCHDASLWGAVKKADTTNCFAGCGSGALNTTDPCYIRCFYSTVLGPFAGKAGGEVTGMPLADLVSAFDAPFESEDPANGGCPGLPIPPLY